MAERGGNGSRRSAAIPDRDAIARACSDLAALVGRPVEAVVGIEREDGEGWALSAQVTELERLPHSTDVLACYRITLDGGGRMTGFRRERRYTRGQGDEAEQ